MRRLALVTIVSLGMIAGPAIAPIRADDVGQGKQRTHFTIYSDQRIDVSVPIWYRGATNKEHRAMKWTFKRVRETVRKRGMSYPTSTLNAIIDGQDGSGVYTLSTVVKYATDWIIKPRYVKREVWDPQAYQGTCTLQETNWEYRNVYPIESHDLSQGWPRLRYECIGPETHWIEELDVGAVWPIRATIERACEPGENYWHCYDYPPPCADGTDATGSKGLMCVEDLSLPRTKESFTGGYKTVKVRKGSWRVYTGWRKRTLKRQFHVLVVSR